MKPKVLNGLLRPNGKPGKWVNWPALLKAIEIIWQRLRQLSNQELDPLLLASELKKISISVHDFSTDAGVGVLAINENTEPESVAEAFQENIWIISGQLM